MSWACYLCGRAHTGLTERANCECGQSFVLAMVPSFLVDVEPGRVSFNHGYSGYTHHGCRCDVCTTANREKQRKVRAQGVAS